MSDSVEVDVRRVLPREPFATVADYVAAGGGEGLTAARAVAPETIIEELAASGLRGRGGAGFPTGEKWRTIKSFASPVLRTSVVVNAAEGEPGTFKDRLIIRDNPYAVIEGALIAARAMDAQTVLIATKAAFVDEVARLRTAIAEAASAGWLAVVEMRVVEGPSEYLYGEETALLEVLDDRPPFPRIAPPYRRGIDEVDTNSGDNLAPPVLVNNVETMANVAAIIAKGAGWFRSIGTDESPGTILATITGAVQQPGVFEVAMGTTLRQVIEHAGGLQSGRTFRCVMVGVSSAILTPEQLDTELTYEAMAAIGSGLGSAGFVVIADDTEPISVAAGASRFLAVESCGQCTPCKQDGLEIARLLAGAVHGQGNPQDLIIIKERLATVADGARCSLASQQQHVIGSLLNAFDSEVSAQFEPNVPAVEPYLVAALVDIDAEGTRMDTSFPDKQPDWTYDEIDSGKTPVERFTDHRTSDADTLDGR